MVAVLGQDGTEVLTFPTCEAFLEKHRPGQGACLLLDAYLPGMSGLELLKRLRDAGDPLPAIMMTGASDVAIAVRSMKAGAADFVEKPIRAEELVAVVRGVVEQFRSFDET